MWAHIYFYAMITYSNLLKNKGKQKFESVNLRRKKYVLKEVKLFQI